MVGAREGERERKREREIERYTVSASPSVKTKAIRQWETD
jgi:hypothetical protein